MRWKKEISAPGPGYTPPRKLPPWHSDPAVTSTPLQELRPSLFPSPFPVRLDEGTSLLKKNSLFPG